MQLTSNYKYSDYEQEHIFSCRGRPFAVLVSSFLPTPPASLIDYDLVKDLKLKMTDIQCKKFSFAGNKLRILGTVSTSVQCVHNGRLIGNHHIRARVVSDLNKTFDTHCIAGDKLRLQLCPTTTAAENDTNHDDDDDESFSKSSESPRARGSTCQNIPRSCASDRSMPRPPVRSEDILLTPVRDHRPTSVPLAGGGPLDVTHGGGGPLDVTHDGGGPLDVTHGGGGPFDAQPRDGDDDDHPDDLHLDHGCETPRPVPAKEIADQANFNAAQANNYTIVLAFGDADLAKTEDEARKILLKHCPCGTEERMEPKFTFTHYDGYLFQFGHGRNKCSRRKCLTQPDARLPSNCVFHDQWCWPTNFSHCSLQCRGAFCSCLDNYPSQHGDYFQSR